MVLLKMGMPKNCNECLLCIPDDNWATCSYCRLDAHGDEYMIDSRAEDCPIIAEIPDNPTNGDVIKALFPSQRELRYEDGTIEVTFVDDTFNVYETKWWEALYNKGVEE